MGKCKLGREQLLTILQEIEAVINTRPLIYLADDINSNEALTPTHFLSINSKVGIPDVDSDNNVENLSKVLLQSWKRGQEYLNRFWTVWSDEYLKSLRETHTVNMKPIKGEVNRIPRVGEVVIIKEEGIARGSWKMARIENLIKSDIDDICRAAALVTSSGRLLKRPFRLIYPLEGRDIDEATNDDEKTKDPVNRIQRKAAAVAKMKIHEIRQ